MTLSGFQILVLSFSYKTFIFDLCLSCFAHWIKSKLAYYDIYSKEDRLNTYSDMTYCVTFS